jgi:hypothetical protein
VEIFNWVVQFAAGRAQNLNLVQLVIVPKSKYTMVLEGAGNGLFLNESTTDKTLAKISSNVDSNDAGKVVKGNCLAVKEFDVTGNTNRKARLLCAWIIWHEYGHAVAQKNNQATTAGPGELIAYNFELEAITAAWTGGTLAQYGIQAGDIRDYMPNRKATAPYPTDIALKAKYNTLAGHVGGAQWV